MNSRRRTPERVVAAALIALWLAVPLAFVFHGSHDHHYCLEHQSFEEGEGRENRCAEGLGLRLTAEVSPTSGEAHEACPVSPQRRSSALASRRSVACDGMASGPVALVERDWRGTPQFAPLTRAPKHGPPAVDGRVSSLS